MTNNNSHAVPTRTPELGLPAVTATDEPIADLQGSHPLLRTTCYCCGLTRESDYTTLFDLGYQGRNLVDLCDDCREKVEDTVEFNCDTEYMCDDCIDKTAIFSIDGGCLRLCGGCQERRAVQEMHDSLPAPMFAPKVAMLTVWTIVGYIGLFTCGMFMATVVIAPSDFLDIALHFWGAK